MTTRRTRRGFSLIEVLIVVALLAILGLIVLPHAMAGRESAMTTNVRAQLKHVRTALNLYKLEHMDSYPTLAELQAGWDVLIHTTDVTGFITPGSGFGPYLQQPPQNVFTSGSTVVVSGFGTAADGWEYDEASGQISAVGFDEHTGAFVAP